MPAPSPFVGLDIAKADFVIALRPPAETWTAANDDAGIRHTVERLVPLVPALVVLEATGGYETALAVALIRAGLPVVVATPRQVRDFAKATGQLAKTDRLDAHILALFAERVRPEPRPLPGNSSTPSSRGAGSCSRCSRPSAIASPMPSPRSAPTSPATSGGSSAG